METLETFFKNSNNKCNFILIIIYIKIYNDMLTLTPCPRVNIFNECTFLKKNVQ